MSVVPLISEDPTTTVGSTVAVTPVRCAESFIAAALAIAELSAVYNPSQGSSSEYGSSALVVALMSYPLICTS